jgi:hypothetical protein
MAPTSNVPAMLQWAAAGNGAGKLPVEVKPAPPSIAAGRGRATPPPLVTVTCRCDRIGPPHAMIIPDRRDVRSP